MRCVAVVVYGGSDVADSTTSWDRRGDHHGSGYGGGQFDGDGSARFSFVGKAAVAGI